MASTALTKTFGSASSASDRYKFTFSTWFKRGTAGDNDYLFGHQSSSGANDFAIRLDKDSGNSILRVYDYQSNSYNFHKQTSRFFRDHSAWYHLVVKIDTTQSSASDRVKIYINGTEETSFGTSVDPSQNLSIYAFSNTGRPTVICGRYTSSLQAAHYFDGSLTHTNCCIGYAYDASSFGETDSTSGIWKPKTAPSVTYGTNGFFLKMENSGAMGTDSSGNSNTFTVSGTLTQNVDTPSNNFATMNPLDNYWMNGTFANGNTTVTTTSAEYGYNTGTLGASSGKFYWEMKLIQPVSGTNYVAVGIAGRHPYNAEGLGYRADAVAYQGYDGQKRVNGSTSSYGNTWTTNDIIGIAMDLDNSKLYFSKNGTWQDSGDPTSGATGTGAISITAVGSTEAGFYFPAVSDHAGSSWTNAIFSFNFGNGFFGTTAISSEGTNASGIGKFEYDVPAGYTALSTKGLNE